MKAWAIKGRDGKIDYVNVDSTTAEDCWYEYLIGTDWTPEQCMANGLTCVEVEVTEKPAPPTASTHNVVQAK